MNENVVSTDELAEKILNGIEKQPFFDWHGENGDFEKFIEGQEGCKSREEILEDIKRLFNL